MSKNVCWMFCWMLRKNVVKRQVGKAFIKCFEANFCWTHVLVGSILCVFKFFGGYKSVNVYQIIYLIILKDISSKCENVSTF